MRLNDPWLRFGLGTAVLASCVGACQAAGEGADTKGPDPAKSDPVAVGYEIFHREWMPGDPRSHGGDGLGPVYNDTSCVACHNSGGSGGGGPISKNIEILGASLGSARRIGDSRLVDVPTSPFQPRLEPSTDKERTGVPATPQAPGAKRPQARAIEQPKPTSPPGSVEALAELHPGFRSGPFVVLHKSGTDPNYESWRNRPIFTEIPERSGFDRARAARLAEIEALARKEVELETSRRSLAQGTIDRSALDSDDLRDRLDGRVPITGDEVDRRIGQLRAEIQANHPTLQLPASPFGPFLLARSQRNPSPLFGLGLVDTIPDGVIEAIAESQANESPRTKGRPSRLKNGRIGKLGWKGQTADVREFVLNACAVEIGLEVPGHHQALIPQAPRYQAGGFDLNADECDALVAYVRSLPRPVERKPASGAEAKHLAAGKAAFASVGCTTCHTPKVGDVEGIYSDFLLHDMGQDMAQEGSYAGITDDSSGDLPAPEIGRGVTQNRSRSGSGESPNAASKREWRTPPLWGFRDSSPYLHDGRAQNLDQAVAMHGGQGALAAQRFFQLSPSERLQIEAFLKSLVAPPAAKLAQVSQ